MSRHLRPLAVHMMLWVLTLGRYGVDGLCSCWDRLRYRDVRVPIEVLTVNGARRRKIDRELRTGLRQLQRILGDPPLPDIAIVVQQMITTHRELAGCCHLGQRPDGTPYALWRLALQVNGRPLSGDELLAVLAENWMVLVHQQNASSVLVPVDFEPHKTSAARPSSALRPDPLIPHPNAAHPHRA